MNRCRATSVVGLCWGHYEWGLCWGHTVSLSLPRLGLQHPPHQYGLLSSTTPHDKSQASIFVSSSDAMWYADVTKASQCVTEYVTFWQRSHHCMASKWSKGAVHAHWSENKLENTGIFVFSRVCPSVCSKQTNKHGLSSLSGKQRFQAKFQLFNQIYEKY